MRNLEQKIICLTKTKPWDFPGGAVVRTSPSNAGVAGSIPGWGAKMEHASWPKQQSIRQKQHCNKFNIDFKDMVYIKKKKMLKKKKTIP